MKTEKEIIDKIAYLERLANGIGSGMLHPSDLTLCEHESIPNPKYDNRTFKPSCEFEFEDLIFFGSEEHSVLLDHIEFLKWVLRDKQEYPANDKGELNKK